jgi:hypothetical protein
MIVRIIGEGQLDVPDAEWAALNELDEALADAVATRNHAKFGVRLRALLDKVRAVGKPVPAEEIVVSDFILQGSESTLEDVRDLLSSEGLIRG